MNRADQERPAAPTWPAYLVARWKRSPTWMKVFGAVFGALLVLALLIGATAWLFLNGWIVTGVIGVCAASAAFITLFAALITEGKFRL